MKRIITLLVIFSMFCIVPSSLYSADQSSAPFSVVIVGSGCPVYNAARSGPSALVQYGDKNYLVDVGNGTQARLNALGLTIRDLTGILITHHHLDHNEEFIPLYISACLAGGQVEFIGPPGTKSLADFILKFYAEDIAYRLGPRDIKNNTPSVMEINGGDTFSLGRIKVTTAEVNHTIYTVAYRFDVEGKSIAISGDTAYSENLVKLARDVDVLIMDSGGSIVPKRGTGMNKDVNIQRPKMQRTNMQRRPGNAPGRTGPQKAHATMQEVGEMAAKAGVKKLVLTHILPGEVDEKATRAALSNYYSGDVVVAYDGLKITVP